MTNKDTKVTNKLGYGGRELEVRGAEAKVAPWVRTAHLGLPRSKEINSVLF